MICVLFLRTFNPQLRLRRHNWLLRCSHQELGNRRKNAPRQRLFIPTRRVLLLGRRSEFLDVFEGLSDAEPCPLRIHLVAVGELFRGNRRHKFDLPVVLFEAHLFRDLVKQLLGLLICE